jgi:citrate lyase beta subunit
VAAFEEHEALGAMAFKFDGEMVDVPHLKRAQQVLALARRNDAGNN